MGTNEKTGQTMKSDLKEMWYHYKNTLRELPDALDTLGFIILAPILVPAGLIYRAIKRRKK